MSTDPFTQVYQELWNVLDGCVELNQIVQLHNRVRCDGALPVAPQAGLLPSDLPRLSLVPTGGRVDLATSMNGVAVQQQFDLDMQTGDERIQEVLFPLKWILCGCLLQAHENDLGLAHVKCIHLREVDENLRAASRLPGRQWQAVFHITAELGFDRDDWSLTFTS